MGPPHVRATSEAARLRRRTVPEQLQAQCSTFHSSVAQKTRGTLDGASTDNRQVHCRRGFGRRSGTTNQIGGPTHESRSHVTPLARRKDSLKILAFSDPERPVSATLLRLDTPEIGQRTMLGWYSSRALCVDLSSSRDDIRCRYLV